MKASPADRARRLALLTVVLLAAACQRAAPPVVVTRLDAAGLEARLEAGRGRLRVLNFWATWCVPCVTEMPLLARAALDHAGPRLEMLGIACDPLVGGDLETIEANVRTFATRHALGFEQILFTGGEDDLARLFHHPGSLPYTLVLAADGTRLWAHEGVLAPGQLDAALAPLLAHRP